MTVRVAFDSDNIDAIPDNAEIVFFYNDGEPGSATAEQLQRFAGRILVPITRKPGVRSYLGDVESGTMTVQEAVEEFDKGNIKAVYFQKSRWDSGEVPNAFGDRVYGKWVADYPGNLTVPTEIPAPFDGWQYASPAQGVPGHYDLSVVSETWPVPTPIETSPPVQEPPVVADPTDAPVEDADHDSKLQAPIVDAVWFPGGGYMVGADGGVFTSGSAPFYGSMAGHNLAHAVCSIVVDPSAPHNGYTLVAEDGGSFKFGPTAPEVDPL